MPSAIGEVDLHERETRVASRDCASRACFSVDVVIVVEIVEPDDLVAALEQVFAGVMPDEAGRAGDEYFQRSAPVARVRDERRKRPSAGRA